MHGAGTSDENFADEIIKHITKGFAKMLSINNAGEELVSLTLDIRIISRYHWGWNRNWGSKINVAQRPQSHRTPHCIKLG